MDDPGKTIFGIVVLKTFPIYNSKNESKCIIWSNETYTGADGHIIVPEDQNIKPGDWVTVHFTKEEADSYFPSVKSPHARRFKSSNFNVIPELYETRVDGKTVRVSFNYTLSVNQAIIDHHFFGKIYNNGNIPTPNRLQKLTIRRVEPDGIRESVWVLERIEEPEIEMENEKRVIGIVAGTNKNMPNLVYLWCKETVPGPDLTIQFASEADVLKLGTWILLEFTPSEYSAYFAPSISFKPPCTRYSVMEPIHKTFAHGKTIKLELDCYIEGSVLDKDIWHPFVGVIINQMGPIRDSGEYLIQITRGAKKLARDGVTESVWFLKEKTMIKSTFPPPPRDLNLPSSRQELVDPQVLRQMMNAASPQNLPQSFGQLQLQARDFPETYRNVARMSQPPPIPTPSPQPTPVTSRNLAMITNIQSGNFEKVFLWLLDVHKSAILKLSVPAEKLDLKEGSIFKADFIHEDKISSTGPIQKQNDPSYETRKDPIGVQVRIYSEMYYSEEPGHRWPRIWHDHFGDVYDNYQKLSQTNARIKKHVWIRRAKVYDDIHWVIVEEIL